MWIHTSAHEKQIVVMIPTSANLVDSRSRCSIASFLSDLSKPGLAG
jgi:hypothetical protein